MNGRETVDFYDEIQRLIRAEPFVPFTIVMSSGTRYDVRDRFTCAGGKSTFTVYPLEGGHFFFPYYQISSIEVLEPAV